MEKKAKILPNDLEAEQSLLGCLFISQDACAEIFPTVAVVIGELIYKRKQKRKEAQELLHPKKDVFK